MAAPKGNKFSVQDRRMLTNALRRSIARKAMKGPDAAARIADKLVDKALDGEPWAVGMVFDRLEGKPAQSVSLTGGDENDMPIAITIKGK